MHKISDKNSSLQKYEDEMRRLLDDSDSSSEFSLL